MSNKKGEIATILTIGSLVVLGAVSVVSTIFLKKPGKTQPRASSCSIVSSVSYRPLPVQPGHTFTCEINGQIVNQYTMACGWSKNGGWPQGQLSGRCSGNNCTFQVKMEDQVDPNASYELVGFDFRNGCGPTTGNRADLSVAGVNPQQNQPPLRGDNNNSCFNINADIDVRQEGDKKAFYVYVTFNSSKAGDIWLEYGKNYVAGPNTFSGGSFTYDPKWTQPHTHEHEAGIAALSNGESIQFTYLGRHEGCVPQETTISCSVGVSQDGYPWVSGTNCKCRNCNNLPISSSNPTPTPTPKPKPIPGELRARSEEGSSGSTSTPTSISTPNPTQSPTPTPTPTPTSSPTSTPTPTLSSLPKPENVINLKGNISFFIPFQNNKYYSDYERFYNDYFLSSFDFLLQRKTNCNLFNGALFGCSYRESVTKDSNGIKILYDNIDRYYSASRFSLEPNEFYFSASYLGNYYEIKRFKFNDYYHTSLLFNDLPPVDLAKYYRKVSLRFLKEYGYLYQDGNSIDMTISPSPVNYSKITKVSFDNNIDIIYIDFYDPLPSSITITAIYSCGNDKMYSGRVQDLSIYDLNSSENDVGAVTLNCSESQTN